MRNRAAHATNKYQLRFPHLAARQDRAIENAIAERRNQGPAGYWKFHRNGDEKMIVK
jgi:hypothetical protein